MRKLLEELEQFIDEAAVEWEGEHGCGRDIGELIAEHEMPDVWYLVRALLELTAGEEGKWSVFVSALNTWVDPDDVLAGVYKELQDHQRKLIEAADQARKTKLNEDFQALFKEGEDDVET